MRSSDWISHVWFPPPVCDWGAFSGSNAVVTALSATRLTRCPISRAVSSSLSGVRPSAPACRATFSRISPAAPFAASKPLEAASLARRLAAAAASPTRSSSRSLFGSALAIRPPIRDQRPPPEVDSPESCPKTFFRRDLISPRPCPARFWPFPSPRRSPTRRRFAWP